MRQQTPAGNWIESDTKDGVCLSFRSSAATRDSNEWYICDKKRQSLSQCEVLITFEIYQPKQQCANCTWQVKDMLQNRRKMIVMHIVCQFEFQISFWIYFLSTRPQTILSFNSILLVLQTIYLQSFYFLIMTNSIRNNACT